MVPNKGIEFERPPESLENPTSTSRILLYNIHEMSNKPGICNTVNKQSNKCSLLMSMLHESWETLLLYMRRYSLLPLVLAVAFIVFILLQASYSSIRYFSILMRSRYFWNKTNICFIGVEMVFHFSAFFLQCYAKCLKCYLDDTYKLKDSSLACPLYHILHVSPHL